MQLSSFVSSFVFVFRKEENLIALLVYSLFIRVATTMLRRVSSFMSSASQVKPAEFKSGENTSLLRIQ